MFSASQSLELTLDQLEEFAIGISAAQLKADPHAFYCEVRRRYLRGDVAELDELIVSFIGDGSAFHRLVLLLAKLRLCIRAATIDHKFLAECAALFPSAASSFDLAWLGEAHIVMAMYYETFGDDAAAEGAFEKAFLAFRQAKSTRKMATAYLNKIAAASRQSPDKRFLYEYQKAAQLAQDAGDFGVLGAAKINLSREYQLMGANFVALDLANEAVRGIRKTHFGTYQYYHALAHRCHLHAVMGNMTLAKRDFDELLVSSIPEMLSVIENLKIVLNRLGVEAKLLAQRPQAKHASSLTWIERAAATDEPPVLTEMENKLIKSLMHGSKDKASLIEELYGRPSANGYFLMENRLKQLIHRLRKKRSDLISYRDGRFELQDKNAFSGVS